MYNRIINILAALFFIGITEGIGFLSSLLSGDISAKYMELIKPPLSPPGWLFGIMWVILYALMGFAAYLVYRSPNHSKKALSLYGVQLILNFAWSIIFFRFDLMWIALAVLILLDITVIYTIKAFNEVDKKAALLMIPYLIWILFATYLNLGFAILNQ